jgi:hypothetical protein
MPTMPRTFDVQIRSPKTLGEAEQVIREIERAHRAMYEKLWQDIKAVEDRLTAHGI